LSIILVLIVDRRQDIQLIHLHKKPRWVSKSGRNDQFIVSKALAMSTLSKMHEIPWAWRSFAEDWTTRKLSWMALPWINAL
jgi:hypothetical protein